MPDTHALYAEEVVALSGARSPALRRALAIVRREEFLPPGPWVIEALNGCYYSSDDADPRHVLHGVGVALDVGRQLYNANPVRFAEQMMSLEPKPGETVFHVGAGVGYYSALLAELVGPSGRVLAAEIEPVLRERARANLADRANVEVMGDALEAALPPIDILYSSAGLGALPLGWLAALRPGGRMIVPITDAHDHGLLFLFHKVAGDRPWQARMLSFTRHYPCLGTRDDSDLAAISSALPQPPSRVASLRLDPHEKTDTCWLHGQGWCLSTLVSG
jgi:protein-L-isoaspartate(D-aspartate) O-methyltransferase